MLHVAIRFNHNSDFLEFCFVSPFFITSQKWLRRILSISNFVSFSPLLRSYAVLKTSKLFFFQYLKTFSTLSWPKISVVIQMFAFWLFLFLLPFADGERATFINSKNGFSQGDVNRCFLYHRESRDNRWTGTRPISPFEFLIPLTPVFKNNFSWTCPESIHGETIMGPSSLFIKKLSCTKGCVQSNTS